MKLTTAFVSLFMIALLGSAGWLIDRQLLELSMVRTELKLVEEMKRTLTAPQYDQAESLLLVNHYLSMTVEAERAGDVAMTRAAAGEAWKLAAGRLQNRQERERVANICRELTR